MGDASANVEAIETREALEALMAADGPPAIIDFWASWCGPCRMMAPHFEAVAKDFAGQPIRFCKLDTERHPELAAAFRVQALPTLLLVHRGEVKDALVGFRDATVIRGRAQWLLDKASGKGLLSRLFGRG